MSLRFWFEFDYSFSPNVKVPIPISKGHPYVIFWGVAFGGRPAERGGMFSVGYFQNLPSSGLFLQIAYLSFKLLGSLSTSLYTPFPFLRTILTNITTRLTISRISCSPFSNRCLSQIDVFKIIRQLRMNGQKDTWIFDKLTLCIHNVDNSQKMSRYRPWVVFLLAVFSRAVLVPGTGCSVARFGPNFRPIWLQRASASVARLCGKFEPIWQRWLGVPV